MLTFPDMNTSDNAMLETCFSFNDLSQRPLRSRAIPWVISRLSEFRKSLMADSAPANATSTSVDSLFQHIDTTMDQPPPLPNADNASMITLDLDDPNAPPNQVK